MTAACNVCVEGFARRHEGTKKTCSLLFIHLFFFVPSCEYYVLLCC